MYLCAVVTNSDEGSPRPFVKFHITEDGVASKMAGLASKWCALIRDNIEAQEPLVAYS